MLVLICYDIANASPAGARRLRRVASACKDYGVRVQYSVFECRIDHAAWVALKHRLLAEYEEGEDSFRFYFLDGADAARTEHHGIRSPIDPTGPLVI